MLTPTSIDWPSVTIGGQTFTLRFSYAAYYQLAKWGVSLGTADTVELAAASAGQFSKSGDWKPHGFTRALDLAALMTEADEATLIQAVTEALKKVVPEAAISAQQIPAAE